MKRWVKWSIGIVSFPFVLFILLLILIYIPPIQNLIKDKAVAYVKESTGLDVSIRRVTLSFPLSLVIKDVYAGAEGDTLLAVNRFVADVRLWPLLKSQVEIDAVELDGAKVDSKDMIPGMTVRGNVGNLYLNSHGVDLSSEEVVVNELTLKDSDVSLCLADTTASDTTSSDVKWKINIVKVDVDNVGFSLDMPLDTLRLQTYLGQLRLRDGVVDLGISAYGLNSLRLENSSFGFATTNDTTSVVFNPADMMLTDIGIEMDSLLYKDKEINVLLRKLGMKEKSGLTVESGQGHIYADNSSIYIKNLNLKTASSVLGIEASADWALLDSLPHGNLSFVADMSLGVEDAEYFIGKLHKDIPRKPVKAKVDVEGSLDGLEVASFTVNWDKVFDLQLTGSAENILDSITRSASVKLDVKTGNLGFAGKVFNLTESGVRIPQNMSLVSDIEYAGEKVKADLYLKEGSSVIDMKAGYGLADERYFANLVIDSLDVTHFYDIDSLSLISLNLDAEGRGLDLYSARTKAKMSGHIASLAYGGYDLSNTDINFDFDKHNGQLTIESLNNWLKSRIGLGLEIGRRNSSASLAVNVDRIDLQDMMGLDVPFSTALNFTLDANTDMDKMVSAIGHIGDVVFNTDGKETRPKDIYFEAYTAESVSELSVNAGDLFLTVNGDQGATTLMEMVNTFSEKLGEQLVEHRLNYGDLKQYLPDLYFEITAANDNPFSNYLRMMNVDIANTRVRVEMNPVRGLAGDLLFSEVAVDSIKLDSAYMWFVQDTTGIRYKLNVINRNNMAEFVSNAVVKGQITGTYADVLLDFYNPKGEKGLYLGCRSDFLQDGMMLTFFPENPMFLFRKFTLNNDNHIFLGDDGTLDANLIFKDSLNTGLTLLSSVTKRGYPRQTAILSGISLADIRALIPTLPDINGILSAQMSYTALEKTFSLSGNVGLENFVYEKKPVGNFSVNVGYLPLDDGRQVMGGKLEINGKEVASVGGKYTLGETAAIEYRLNLTEFPLSIANPFIPDGMAVLDGNTTGELKLNGTIMKPILNGNMSFLNTSVFIPMAGARFRFDNRPVRVENSRLLFDKFALFTRTDNPFTIDGNVDFSDMSKMTTNLRFITSNYELLNAKRTKESVAYGRVNIDADVSVTGALSAPKVRGSARLLGNTDLTYILQESSLTVQDRLGETVTFVNMSDTATVSEEVVEPVLITGMDVLLNMSIDPTARINIYLSNTGDNKVEVVGGGDLSMNYSPQGDLSLTGRYTFSGGKITYSLPLVKIADFSVRNGGYIEWTGNPMNPSMNLSAVKRVRTDVPNADGEGSRKTNFDVSINLTNTLEDLGLAFGIEAPEDGDVQNELAAMSEDERVEAALLMMTLGIYKGSSANSNFNMGSALNSLVQSEISSAAGKIKAVDLSLGMENPNGSEGFENMDISYKISKRFLNDRFSISLGGKISTGADAAESNKESFIDNVSVEYRLDNSGTRYVKLFHNKNFESVLEGEITETGAGIVLRKKMLKLRELFIFRKNKVKPVDDDKDKK